MNIKVRLTLLNFLEFAAVNEPTIKVAHAHIVVEAGLLLLHDVDDIVGSGLVHLA